ncbi:exocyst subunit exo70 family protein H7 [Artemisia annua]|uniref:Exocyst subunit Exo70 family protein n=1 Tax=Artemisia annua TaxID=35608 RepID=A0A2U1KG27_ARTAN|nr:exocyst subunit exo70 family protein H7 [Artemisia annua]
MNYLVFLSDYSISLSDILADWPHQVQSPLPESYFSSDNMDESSSISARFAWLVLVLLCKIDTGAELYKDVNSSNLRDLMGDNWLVKHGQKVNQYAGNYERMLWGKVISSLPENPIADGLTTEVARNSFRRFNLEFNEAYQKQSSWVISDTKIRDQIKISVAKKILPVYKMFYERYREVFQGADSVVRFAPDDLGNYLSDLFHGTGATGSTM